MKERSGRCRYVFGLERCTDKRSAPSDVLAVRLAGPPSVVATLSIPQTLVLPSYFLSIRAPRSSGGGKIVRTPDQRKSSMRLLSECHSSLADSNDMQHGGHSQRGGGVLFHRVNLSRHLRSQPVHNCRSAWREAAPGDGSVRNWRSEHLDQLATASKPCYVNASLGRSK